MPKKGLSKTAIIALCFAIVIIITALTLLIYNANYKKELVNYQDIRKTIEGDNYVDHTEASSSIVNLIIENYEGDDTNLTEEERYIKSIKPRFDFARVDNRDKKDVFHFVGDVYFSNNIKKAYDEGGIDNILDEDFRKILSTSDLNVANLECSITDDKENADDKTFTFALPSKYVNGLKELNVDLFTIANNHILDYGMQGLDNTIKTLDSLNIAHIGAGDTYYDAKRVYIKEIEGKRYVFLAASAVLPSGKWMATEGHGGVYNGYDIESVAREVEIIKPYFDNVIVYMHWGNELENESNKNQKRCAHRLVDAGADLVIGTHAHTTQEIEYYNDVPIVYSLGNFIYGGQSRDMYMLEATFDYSSESTGTVRLRVYPGISGYKSTRKYEKESETSAKLKNLDKKSDTCSIDDDGFVIHD